MSIIDLIIQVARNDIFRRINYSASLLKIEHAGELEKQYHNITTFLKEFPS